MQKHEFIKGEAGLIQFDYIAAKASDNFTSIGKQAESCLAIICHPHPVHGGTKDNKVVHTLCRAWKEQGIDSLRFNFRGVGQSEGSFDEGVGEYHDLSAVIEFALENYPNKNRLILAGFSFGAFIAAKASLNNIYAKTSIALVLIAPPVFYPEFPVKSEITLPTLVVQGDIDEVVSLEQVGGWCKPDTNSVIGSSLKLEVVVDAGHFFHKRLNDLKDKVQAFTSNLLN